MPENIPLPGSTRARLIDAGLRLFAAEGYAAVEVDVVAAEAGVTVGALYHHFRSKAHFYGVLRDEMTQRLLDRIEAAADAVPAGARLGAGVLAAFDGALRIRAGHLLAAADPRDGPDAIAATLGRLAASEGRAAPEMLGQLLAAVLRTALLIATTDPDRQSAARSALEQLVGQAARR
jgi:AcrR family transcriptional regulator